VRRGKGLALVIKATITPSTSAAALKINEDGSLNVLTSSVELGQGAKPCWRKSPRAPCKCRSAAFQFRIPIRILPPTISKPVQAGRPIPWAVRLAKPLADLKRQLFEYAGELLEVSLNDLVLEEGRVTVRGSPSRSISYGEVALRSNQGNLIGRGAFSTRGGLDLETGQGIGSVHWHQGAIGCELEVDIETGKITVLRLIPVVFAGRVVNPRLCELQLEGSAIFGLGQALFEEMTYDDHGQVINANLGDYNIPSFADIPWEINSFALKDAGSADLHGIGETLLPPVMAAIGIALHSATGVRLRHLPLTAEKILLALQNGDARD